MNWKPILVGVDGSPESLKDRRGGESDRASFVTSVDGGYLAQ